MWLISDLLAYHQELTIFMLIIVGFIALLYILRDVNYFIRIAFTIGYGRLFMPKVKPTDEVLLFGVCTTQDVDIFLRHMNNARFSRDLDFARFRFYERSGIYDVIMKHKGHALQGASSIRYRRPIPIFTTYKITTKIIYWDDKSIYLEHKFISLSDNFIRAIALSKQIVIGIAVPDLLKGLLKDEYKELEMPQELKQWNDSIETSSAKLRKSD